MLDPACGDGRFLAPFADMQPSRESTSTRLRSSDSRIRSGRLALADLIGLDTCVAIMEVLQEGLGDDRYAPCPLLRELVTDGKLGRKSGAGFYKYP